MEEVISSTAIVTFIHSASAGIMLYVSWFLALLVIFSIIQIFMHLIKMTVREAREDDELKEDDMLMNGQVYHSDIVDALGDEGMVYVDEKYVDKESPFNWAE